MKNWFGKTLLVILAVSLLIAGGYTLYRFGYAHGMQASFASEMPSMWAEHFENMPHTDYWHQRKVPYSRFGSGMMDGYSRMPFGSHRMDGYSRMPFGSHTAFGMGGFFFLPFLFRVLFWGFIIWLAYKLFTKSGWKLTRETEPAAPVVDETPADEA